MSYQQGELVVHHQYGVGTIQAIEGRDFGNAQPGLFYRVRFTSATVWIRLEDQPSPGLRPITPKLSLPRYQAVLSEVPIDLGTDFRQRHDLLQSRVQSGTFEALCEIVRDLMALNRRKPLNNYERNVLGRARDALTLEWSVTSGLPLAKVQEEIDGYLLK